MDLAQTLVLELGWIFFAAWAMVLVALSFIAFGGDLVPSRERNAAQKRGP